MTEDLGSGGTTTVATLTAATAPEDDALEAPGSGAGASGSGRDANAHGLVSSFLTHLARSALDVKKAPVLLFCNCHSKERSHAAACS